MSREIAKCKGDNAADRCWGGAHAGVDGIGYCNPLYAGPECRVCSRSGFYQDDTGTCHQCPEIGPRIGGLAGLTAALVAVLLTFLFTFKTNFAACGRRLELRRRQTIA